MSGMSICQRGYLGHSNLLHCSVALYNFVAGDRFVNPEENPACPTSGIHMWTTLQGKGDIGEWMTLADADVSTLDGRKIMADQIT